MNKYQMKVVKTILAIIDGIAFTIFAFAGIAYHWWVAELALTLILGGYMAFALVLLTMDAILRWRIRGACQCDDDLDVIFWFRATIQENRFEETIDKLMRGECSYIKALGLEGTIETLKRFSQVKRPKFLWWEY